MNKAYLFYDGECPFCKQYSKFRELRECIDIELCDARENFLWKDVDSNLNLDDGIILLLEKDSTILQGVEALAYLDTICTFDGLFFKIQKFIFSNKFLASIVYAILKILRKITLYCKRTCLNTVQRL